MGGDSMSIDEWLWGGGYNGYIPNGAFDRIVFGANIPALPEPIQHTVLCTTCDKPVPPDDHFALNGLPYHRLCLPAEGGA